MPVDLAKMDGAEMTNYKGEKEVGKDGRKRCPQCRKFDCTSIIKNKYNGQDVYYIECICGEFWDEEFTKDYALEKFDMLDRTGLYNEYCPDCGAEKQTDHWYDDAYGYRQKFENDFCPVCGWISTTRRG